MGSTKPDYIGMEISVYHLLNWFFTVIELKILQ